MWFATDGGVSRYESGVFTNYTVANGLSDNSVWSMMLDKSGTIWVGTHEGVCRFDGESFVPFALPRVEVENPTSRFTPKVVFAMFEDHAGNLWFGTDGEGAHRYDGKSFTSYTTRDGLAGNQVRSICGDRRGRIWLGTNGGGVSCYDGSAYRNFSAKDGLNNDRVYEILEDKAGNMWFSTLGAGACRYDGTSFTSFGEDQGLTINGLPCPCASGRRYGNCHGPNGAHVQAFFEDKDGVLWLGCSGGLFRLDGESVVNVTRDGPWPAPTQEPARGNVARE
jgi:ligand-binding sensor domain-containing protein